MKSFNSLGFFPSSDSFINARVFSAKLIATGSANGTSGIIVSVIISVITGSAITSGMFSSVVTATSYVFFF
jgi:hypothetical protein